MTKKCTKCGGIKDEIYFGWYSSEHKKRLARCKECKNAYNRQWVSKNQQVSRTYCRRYREKLIKQDSVSYRQRVRRSVLKTAYGITPEQYEAMWTAQRGVCAICGRPEIATFRGKIKRLAIDHNHQTRKVRALLCVQCNHGLGRFDDDPELLEKAAAYLRYHKK